MHHRRNIHSLRHSWRRRFPIPRDMSEPPGALHASPRTHLQGSRPYLKGHRWRWLRPFFPQRCPLPRPQPHPSVSRPADRCTTEFRTARITRSARRRSITRHVLVRADAHVPGRSLDGLARGRGCGCKQQSEFDDGDPVAFLHAPNLLERGKRHRFIPRTDRSNLPHSSVKLAQRFPGPRPTTTLPRPLAMQRLHRVQSKPTF